MDNNLYIAIRRTLQKSKDNKSPLAIAFEKAQKAKEAKKVEKKVEKKVYHNPYMERMAA